MQRNFFHAFMIASWRSFKTMKYLCCRTSLPCLIFEIFTFVWYANIIHDITLYLFSQNTSCEVSNKCYSDLTRLFTSGNHLHWVTKFFKVSLPSFPEETVLFRKLNPLCSVMSYVWYLHIKQHLKELQKPSEVKCPTKEVLHFFTSSSSCHLEKDWYNFVA